MRIPLKNNEEIVLNDIDVNGTRQFKIIECIGWGATCLVYRTSCEDKTEHILKEFYPKNLNIIRTENGEIIPPKNDVEKFASNISRDIMSASDMESQCSEALSSSS